MTFNNEIALEVHNLNVVYHRRPALWNIDFAMPAGILTGIMGPNGSGKSTLLKSVMQVIKPDSGWVQVFGKPMEEMRSVLAYVPQRQEIDWDFPASVYDVVSMGRYAHRGLFRRLTKEDHQIISESLEQVQMLGMSRRHISELSGGQQQRVFLARALAQQADLYLMDEPFAGVDAGTEASIIELLREMKNIGKTIVVVHHDISSARNYFDWLVLLNTHLVAAGPVEEVLNDENLRNTYGGRLPLLNTMADELQKKNLPMKH